MPLSDTTPEAQAIQERILRAMTGEQRLLLAWDMSVFARELARAGIRDAHPEWTEAPLTSAAAGRTAMTAGEVFRRITTALDRAGIAYMLSGSFASAHYAFAGALFADD